MDVSNASLLLKRVVNVKVVVTPRWKEEAQQQLQAQINQIDSQLQQLDLQGQRMIAEIQKQSLQPPGPQVIQQIDNIQIQVNQQKSQFLEQKNQILQQLQQVQQLNMEEEVNQGQIESFFKVEQGDNLIEKMQVEILLRDGIVEQIRGDVWAVPHLPLVPSNHPPDSLASLGGTFFQLFKLNWAMHSPIPLG